MKFQNGDKEENLQTSGVERKLVTCKGSGISLKSDFSTAMLKARRQWSYIFKLVKENDQPMLKLINVRVKIYIYI